MKNFWIGFIFGSVITAAVSFSAVSFASGYNVEQLFNFAFDSATNTLRVTVT